MKNSLGRVFFALIIFLHCNLFASTYKWSVESDKTTAMTNEAIYLKYVCEYSDEAELYNIEFNPVVDNEKYRIELLSENEKILNGKKVNSFEYVVFVKEADEVEFVFDTTMKKTNKDSIENTVLGRDNADYEEFSQRVLRQKAISIAVEKSTTNIVGSFKLEVNRDEQRLKAYEPYHLEIVIEGVGNFRALKEIEFEIAGVKIFTQKPVEKISLTQDGYKGSWSQKFAFVGEEDFRIPELKIEYFDLQKREKETFVVKEMKVEVTPAYKKEELLDIDEEKFEINYDYLYYILTFIAGYLFAQIKFKRREKETKNNIFKLKIENTKSLEELMIILALKDSKKYEELISQIESKKLLSLSKCKKLLLN